MPRPRPPIACTGCQTLLVQPAKGRPRTVCPSCQGRSAPPGAVPPGAVIQGTGAPHTPDRPSTAERRSRALTRAQEPLLVATYLSAGATDDEALDRAGVPPSRRASVLAAARQNPGGMLTGDLDALGATIHSTLIATLLELRARLPLVPAGQLGSTLRSLAEVSRDITGGLTPSFGTFSLEIPDPNKVLQMPPAKKGA